MVNNDGEHLPSGLGDAGATHLEDGPMLAGQRQALILAEVNRTGGVRVTDMVTRLGVSDMTVRRDLADLAERGLLTKVHGGAIAVGSASFEPGFATKAALNQAAKMAIAARAAAMVRAGDCVAISAGTTAYEVARALQHTADLTVITNSVPVGDLLAETSLTCILTGGERTPSAALVGPVAVASLTGLHADTAIVGVHGLDLAKGLTTPNLLEADTSRALMDCADRTIVVADASKVGVVGLRTIAPLTDVDVLITDATVSPDAAARLSDMVGELVVV